MKALPVLSEEEIDALDPSFLGPTGLSEPDGSWKLPAHTLGWQIAGWCAEYLNGEGSAKVPLRVVASRLDRGPKVHCA
ncbi:hypothetical protein GCM10017776_25150 [Streptomyces griseoluteus]|nr:hypothetical protein GCM10017776_25150 [Streptomyces griseoluteus]